MTWMRSVDAPRCDLVGHMTADHDVSGRGLQAAIAQNGDKSKNRTFEERYAQFDGDFGIDVLQPIDQMSAATQGHVHCDN